MSFADRTGECRSQPTVEDEKARNTWSLKLWWGKQITHLFTWPDRSFGTSSCCSKCLQLDVNDALQQGCGHQTVDRVKQRSAAVGHIDSVIYCAASYQFAWVRNSSSVLRCCELRRTGKGNICIDKPERIRMQSTVTLLSPTPSTSILLKLTRPLLYWLFNRQMLIEDKILESSEPPRGTIN